MTDKENARSEAVALFRYGVICDLVHLAPGARGLGTKINDKAASQWSIPYSRKNRIARETIRHWLKQYRKGGFDALRPRVRADVGTSRRVPQAVCDILLQIKDDQRDLTVKQVIAAARKTGAVPDDVVLSLSTVHRLLSRHGLMQPQTATESKTRLRFAYDKAGELWMSDVMHGPAIATEASRQKKKTYLVAFLDDATRVIPYAQFCLAESIHAFLPVFKQALLRRGIPKRLYVDNGSAYRTKQLQLICAKLGVTLLHTRPYDAAAKGKQERWFRTVRMQLLPVLADKDRKSLEALNQRLHHFIEAEYHYSPHRGLDRQTPLDVWAQCASQIRLVGPELDVDDLFLWEQRRKVHKDCTISLHGTLYETDPLLVGATVTVRYDPDWPKGRPLQIWHDGKRQSDAPVSDAYQNCFVRRKRADGERMTTIPARPVAPPQGLLLHRLNQRSTKGR